MKRLAALLMIPALWLAAWPVWSYPVDGGDYTGIPRLEGYRLAQQRLLPKGARLPLEKVDLRLTARKELALPPGDPEFSRQILRLLGDEANRYAVARHLRQAGYTVLEAGDGRSALALVAERSPDLMIVDIRMPGLDGFEVVRRLRADTRTAHLPVLHISASFTDPVSQAAGMDSGADGYLTHPVEPVVLLASVRAILRARSAEREAKAAEAAWRATFEAIGDGVCVVEWAEKIAELLPTDCIQVTFTISGGDRREIAIAVPDLPRFDDFRAASKRFQV